MTSRFTMQLFGLFTLYHGPALCTEAWLNSSKNTHRNNTWIWHNLRLHFIRSKYTAENEINDQSDDKSWKSFSQYFRLHPVV